MNLKTIRRAAVPGVAALALLMSACGASNESGSGDDNNDSAGLSGTLKGGGATSQEKAQEAWKTAFQGKNTGLTVDYQLLGSTDGRNQFIAKALSFAGSDSYLKDEDLTKAKERCDGNIVEVPAYISSIAVAYNLPGVDELNLDADTLAKIFDNKITKWNDPAIAAQNDGVDLPDLKITPVHRSDDSGTTKNFTDYLNKVAPDSWKYEAEDAFPVSGGLSAEGTSGVVKSITDTEGVIGYADASQTGDLKHVSVKVGDAYVAPSPEGAAKTVEVSPVVEGRDATDIAVDVDRTTTEAGAYPVILLSYLIACEKYDDKAEADNVKGYFEYIVSDEGQAEAADFAGSAKLAPETAKKVQDIVAGISAK
ncbi:phosphate ABC transporter substrate-binding protein PstS [Pimelobacter simplex]|uniref:Phosphate-binding protein n=2 Tax=Nocardioides simplex TaxID=2045 RepID=A0A0A1DU51_NOCSI|nr:phosphate ABC transporter substrate-binding protein PstS [Pimelobacter simplex]AIY18925.1 Phosphate ABC transporter, periplasmic phosphate-binding protein PstS [Pimelobacter simplex]GEB14669.1 phosphate-binding protein PstS [Pimelobacter simplex]SFM27009.1 phosphate ABC transporter substrate-binding protein, PhoT family [Pimelobacter simplex]